MLIGFLAIGLRREGSPRQTHRLILLVIVVLVGYEAIRIHAI